MRWLISSRYLASSGDNEAWAVWKSSLLKVNSCNEVISLPSFWRSYLLTSSSKAELPLFLICSMILATSSRFSAVGKELLLTLMAAIFSVKSGIELSSRCKFIIDQLLLLLGLVLELVFDLPASASGILQKPCGCTSRAELNLLERF